MNEITWSGATIAWAMPSDVPDFDETDLRAMGLGQVERYRQLAGARATGFLTGRALIRDLVRRLGGGPLVALDSTCVRCGDHHAVPRTAGFVISVSHAGDLVVVGVAKGSALLGVDVEAAAADSRVAELGPMFAPRPAPDLAEWTRIEASIKADGRGVSIDPGAVRLSPVPTQASLGVGPPLWEAVLPARSSPLRVATLAGPVGFVLSAARG
ncbi:MAG: hypothetical protein P0Y60_05400 [Candidatus Microbacterium colombiense]|nr:MAG: hypothetical protein P0Y60_05400 [Microbacterium sp.]